VPALRVRAHRLPHASEAHSIPLVFYRFAFNAEKPRRNLVSGHRAQVAQFSRLLCKLNIALSQRFHSTLRILKGSGVATGNAKHCLQKSIAKLRMSALGQKAGHLQGKTSCPLYRQSRTFRRRQDVCYADITLS
jgi:hypothetical protein